MRSARTLTCLLAATLVTAGVAEAPGRLAAQEVKLPFSLELTPVLEPLKAGQELRLTVTLTNKSEKSITFARSPGPSPRDESFRYEILVKDAQGDLAPPSAYVRSLEGKQIQTSFSNIALTIQPGESASETINVAKYFDLGEPGMYTILVSRGLEHWQKLGEGRATCNTISVNVVP